MPPLARSKPIYRASGGLPEPVKANRQPNAERAFGLCPNLWRPRRRIEALLPMPRLKKKLWSRLSLQAAASMPLAPKQT